MQRQNLVARQGGMQRSGVRLAGLAFALLAAGGPVGCASAGGAESTVSAGAETPVLAPAAGAEDRFRSTVERSALREKAISEATRLAASNNAQVRANALEALEPAKSRLRGPVAAGLVDENEGVRAIAAMVAGRAGLGEVTPSLRGLVRDPSPYARASAIYALRELGQTDVDPTPLGGLLLEYPDARVRAHAAFLLGELGEDSALPMLRQALHADVPSASPQEQELLSLQIAEAMVKLGDRSRLEGIRAALYPASADELEIATLAVQILGRVGDRSSIGSLINLAEYRQGGRGMPAETRLAIAEAVARMGRKDAWFVAEEYAKDENPLLRSLAAHVMGQTKRPQDLVMLEGLLADQSPLVRAAAAAGVLKATTADGGRSGAGVP